MRHLCRCCICCAKTDCERDALKICAPHKAALEQQTQSAAFWSAQLRSSEQRLVRFEELGAPPQLIADCKAHIVRLRLKVAAFENRG